MLILNTKEKVKEYIASKSNPEKITILNLNSRVIKELDIDTFKGLTNLKVLYLSYNQLTTLPEELFQGLTSLKEIHLSYNQLTTLPEELFQGLTSLKELSLRKNQLTTLPSDIFQGLYNLIVLDLSKNQLTSLLEIKGLTNLEWLDLMNNQLTSLPSELLEHKEIIWEFNYLEKEMEENRKILEEQWKEHKKKFKFVMEEIDATPPNAKYYSHLPCFSSFVGVEFYRGLEMLG